MKKQVIYEPSELLPAVCPVCGNAHVHTTDVVDYEDAHHVYYACDVCMSQFTNQYDGDGAFRGTIVVLRNDLVPYKIQDVTHASYVPLDNGYAGPSERFGVLSVITKDGDCHDFPILEVCEDDLGDRIHFSVEAREFEDDDEVRMTHFSVPYFLIARGDDYDTQKWAVVGQMVAAAGLR